MNSSVLLESPEAITRLPTKPVPASPVATSWPCGPTLTLWTDTSQVNLVTVGSLKPSKRRPCWLTWSSVSADTTEVVLDSGAAQPAVTNASQHSVAPWR